MITEDELKTLVPMETVILRRNDHYRIFVGEYKAGTAYNFITVHPPSGDPVGWSREDFMSDFTIKKQTKKYWLWACSEDDGVWWETRYYLDENRLDTEGCSHLGSIKPENLRKLDYTMQEF